MIVLTLDCLEAESELLSAELWECGATGIHEEEVPGGRTRLNAWFDSDPGLTSRFAAYSPRVEEAEERDWIAEVHQAWQPFPVGDRFYLQPEWDQSQPPAGRMRLTIHPGLALGTGLHPCTQLCLAAMERYVQPGDRVIDVGTGTGILVLAARLLGAQWAAGCDMEIDSVDVARRNLQADGVAPLVFAGSLRSVARQSADLVVSNINSMTHRMLADDYAETAKRTLILSGFPVNETERVEKAIVQRGFQLVADLEDSDWSGLIFERPEAS